MDHAHTDHDAARQAGMTALHRMCFGVPVARHVTLLPDTQQALVVLINANTELPVSEVNAVMSRLPIGVVNLVHGQPVPQGPSLRQACFPFNAAAALVVIGLLVLAAALALLSMPSALVVRAWARVGRSSAGTRQRTP